MTTSLVAQCSCGATSESIGSGDVFSHGDVMGAQPSGIDDVWLISSRRIGSTDSGAERLDIWKEIGGNWSSSSLNEFTHSDSTHAPRPVVILVHGNDWSMTTAIRLGLETYRDAFASWQDRPPIRFVIWTWPADKIAGPIRNLRIKAERADEHSIHLARFLERLPNQLEVSMVAYSFGARVTLGALNLLGGGCVDGRRISPVPLSIARINLSLIAPAIRNDALVSSRPAAYQQINHLFVMYNSRDRLLRFFDLARFDGNTPALGFTGLRGTSRLPEASIRIEQYDASRQVGVDHDYLEYLRDKRVEQRLRRNVFFQPLTR